jgi:hypothetical protein
MQHVQVPYETQSGANNCERTIEQRRSAWIGLADPYDTSAKSSRAVTTLARRRFLKGESGKFYRELGALEAATGGAKSRPERV